MGKKLIFLLATLLFVGAKPLTMTYEVSRFLGRNAELGGPALSVREVTALNYLVVNLRANGLWPTGGALYPLVGGSAITQSLNLIDPTTFRLTWLNSVAARHTTNGFSATSNAAANTGITSANITHGNSCLFFYSRTNAVSNSADMGSFDGSTRLYDLVVRYNNAKTYGRAYALGDPPVSIDMSGVGDSRGLFCLNRSGSNIILYRNGTSIGSASGGNATLPPATQTIHLGRRNDEGSVSGREYALAGHINSLTATNHATFYNIIQAYQTILQRQI